MSEFKQTTPETLNYLITELTTITSSLMSDLYRLLLSIDLTTIDLKESANLEKKIDQLFLKKDKEIAKWVDQAIEQGYQSGAIKAIIDLVDAETVEQAKRLVNLNSELNKTNLEMLKKTAYNDLLQMTNNTKQRTKDFISRVVMEVMKGKEIGVAPTDFSREIIKKLREQIQKELDFAVIDRSGRQWTVKAYSEMVARTKITQSQLAGIEAEALMRGANYGIISRHGTKCNICKPWEGRIVKLRNDVPGNYPLLSNVRSVPGKTSVFHPRCKHFISPLRTLEVLPPSLR